MLKGSSRTNPNQLHLLPYVTAGSQVSNKKMILRGKSTSCETSIRMLKLSEILGAVSTSKDAAFKPYWTGFSKVINSNLLLPIGIDCVGSALKRYNTW